MANPKFPPQTRTPIDLEAACSREQIPALKLQLLLKHPVGLQGVRQLVGEGHVGLLGQGQANGRRDPIVLGGLLAGWRGLAADGTEMNRERESRVVYIVYSDGEHDVAGKGKPIVLHATCLIMFHYETGVQ